MDPDLFRAAMNGDLLYLQNMTSEHKSNLPSQLASKQNTVLHIATEFNHFQFITVIIRDCPSLLGQANSSGDTALHIAARKNLVDIIRLFIETGRRHGHLLRRVNLDNDTALHCAARLGNQGSTKMLLQEDPQVCSFLNNVGESPLYLAVSSGLVRIPQHIIDSAPSSASYKGANGLTALHSTMFILDYEMDVIELLLKWRREMITERDRLGLTPLHYAAFYNRIEEMKLFLRYDSSAIYILDDKGESALHIAAFRGHVSALELMANCRPDACFLINNKGRTILHSAVLCDERKVVKFILETPMLAMLINEQDEDGNTPLHLAVLLKLYVVIEILAKNGTANVWIQNKEFLTVLDAYNKHEEIGFKGAVVRHLLNGSSGPVRFQLFIEEHMKTMNKEIVIKMPSGSDQVASTTTAGEQSLDIEKRNALEVNLLVATLVATVTFAAGFTMPGGNFNDGSDEGLAVFTKKASLRMFVVSDTIAFCSSVFAVLLQFHTSAANPYQRVRYMGIATSLTLVAILAMILAFASGIYVVLTKSIGLAVTPYVICGCSALVYYFFPMLDPALDGFIWLDKPQKFVRNVIVRRIGCKLVKYLFDD